MSPPPPAKLLILLLLACSVVFLLSTTLGLVLILNARIDAFETRHPGLKYEADYTMRPKQGTNIREQKDAETSIITLSKSNKMKRKRRAFKVRKRVYNPHAHRHVSYTGSYRAIGDMHYALALSFIGRDRSHYFVGKKQDEGDLFNMPFSHVLNYNNFIKYRKNLPKTASISVMHHLNKAVENGNPQAQNLLAFYLAHGIPLYFHHREKTRNIGNSTSTLEYPNILDDFGGSSGGGKQLARAITLWHFAAIAGEFEAQMVLGYRSHPASESQFGMESSCETSLAYYQEAANTAIDEWIASPLKGKFVTGSDRHNLSEMFQLGGGSSSLSNGSKPNELEEALEYFMLRAKKSSDPSAALTLAALYHSGLRGVTQSMSLAYKYYVMAADLGSKEAAGMLGVMRLYGTGVAQNSTLAYNYFRRAAPGGIDCKAKCDGEALNGLGVMYQTGDPVVGGKVDEVMAMRLFIKAKDRGSSDAIYNMALSRLGWNDVEKWDIANPLDRIATAAAAGLTGRVEFTKKMRRMISDDELKASYNDFNMASRKGNIMAAHRAGIMAAKGLGVERTCETALSHFKKVTDSSLSMSRRMRNAFREYNNEGNSEKALRHYIVAAEMGNEIAQINAAWLLERGVCFSMSESECHKASLRYWKAAALQGNSEANLRVGDYYYYGHQLRGGILDTLWNQLTKCWNSNIGNLANGSITPLIKSLYNEFCSWVLSKGDIDTKKDDTPNEDNTMDGLNNRDTSLNEDGVVDDEKLSPPHFDTAFTYYRKAADKASSRAYFNLGFMHEWGLGIKQDFPLAKRYYDLAAEVHPDALFAVQMAVGSMKIHERLVNKSKL